MELKEETFLLGNAITAGLLGQGGGFGDLGTITVQGAGGGEMPPFLQGFSAGLSKIKEQVTDITKLGKDMALTFQKGMSSALSDTILGVKSAKEAFAEFGKTMLSALVNFVAEWLSFQILSKALAAAGIVFTKGIAAAAAAAWAPAAALASLATLGTNAVPAKAALTSTALFAQAIAIPKFQSGSSGIQDDTIGMFNRREIVVPSNFSDGLRDGSLTLGGPGGGGGIVIDLSGAQINGITDEVVEEIFTKASENITNGTLAFAGGA